jgi:hypothetical protein
MVYISTARRGTWGNADECFGDQASIDGAADDEALMEFFLASDSDGPRA